VKAQFVEMLHQLEVALEAQQRVFVIGMKRRQEDAAAQPVARDLHVAFTPEIRSPRAHRFGNIIRILTGMSCGKAHGTFVTYRSLPASW
jgi:hypothetical protein